LQFELDFEWLKKILFMKCHAMQRNAMHGNYLRELE